MRKKTWWFEIGAIVAVVVTASLLAARPAPSASTWPAGVAPPTAPSGYDAERWASAVALADSDLRRGAARMSLSEAVQLDIDAETGLPGLPRPQTQDERRANEAYAARVRQYISINGLPPNSRRAWISDLMQPAAYFEAHRDSAVKLEPRKVLNDGTTRVALGPDATLRIRGPGERRFRHSIAPYERCEALWGPQGSNTVFVRLYYSGNVVTASPAAFKYQVIATDTDWTIAWAHGPR